MEIFLDKLFQSLAWINKQSWFFAVAFFIVLLLIGRGRNKQDLLEVIITCLIFWLFDALFFRKLFRGMANNLAEGVKKVNKN